MSYIEKEPLIEFITKGLNNPDKTEAFGYDAIEILTEIEYAPTADVVPKSEVDRLVDKWIGEEKLTQDEKTLRLIEALRDEAKRYERYYFNHEYDKLIAEAKTEVAMEIFEEISKASVAWGCYCVTLSKGAFLAEDVNRTLAELKKKYTEEKQK